MPKSPVRRRLVAALLVQGGLLAAPQPAPAQYLFGQNKVIYHQRDWKVISTPRLDVYYYSGEQDLADYVADFAEKVCVEYEQYFDHKFDEKIPLIIYASHHDFKQTNVIDMMISDYVGGFTESIRGRVAIPHTGSFTQLRNVTRHELVHAFMNDKLSNLMNDKKRYNYVPPPLWFSEGLAEYVAIGDPDSEARMFIRDLVVNDNLVEIPDLWRISGTFLMYKEGEALCHYIARRFGDRALVQLLENWWISDRFETVLHETLGLTVEDLNRDWKRFLKRRYYPAVMAGEWPDQHGDAITERRGLNTRPAVYAAAAAAPDSGCDFLFLAAGTGSIDLVRARPEGHDRYRFETVVRGGRRDEVESIPAFSSGPEIHAHRLAFTCKSGKADALVIWDLQGRREVTRFQFESLVGLASPTWGPDGQDVVVAGLDRSGWSDLYRVRLADGSLTRLTFDPADDRDPDWSHDGLRIAWSSDRGAPDQNGVYHLWVLDLDSGSVTPLTGGVHEDAAPSWGPNDASLLFSSDASGASNIYLYEFETSRLTQVTSTLGGLFTPQWLPDGTSFLASSFNNTSFNIYRFGIETRREVTEPTPLPQVALLADPVSAASADMQHSWIRSGSATQFPKKNYDVKFGIDFVRTAVAFDPDFQSGTGGQIGFTDMLGNHQLFLHVSNSAEALDEFWRHMNVGMTYTNLSQRLNYSLGGFHLTSVYDPNLDRFRYERRYGALAGLSYPLSRFRRIETTVVARVAERDAEDAALYGVGSRSVLFSNFSSFVHDNTIWTWSGPTEGMRLNVTLGQTLDFTGTERGGTSAHLDVRHYLPLPMRSVLAHRLVARSNWGNNVQFFFLGGPFDLRGYERRSLFSRRMALLNTELRFPVLDRLLIGLPFNALEFGGFRGALFSDAAYLGGPFTPGWYGNLGFGVEMALGAGFIARWDFGRTHDFKTISPGTFSRFFLGWDY
jgi:hypothetical protein